ncbi:hypothetical protein HaLaN_30397, partial [Haematococcus lacustris]
MSAGGRLLLLLLGAGFWAAGLHSWLHSVGQEGIPKLLRQMLDQLSKFTFPPMKCIVPNASSADLS